MRIYIIILVIIAVLLGCSKYDYDNSELNNSEFQPYVDSFMEEAKTRGYDINTNNINFYLADIENENVGGLCNQRKEEIVIDRDNWDIANEIEKELLIYHELGHCSLGRAHKNETSKTGDCLSIMDGTENNFDCSKNIYSSRWRAYYLDELFNKSTVLPNWYTENQEYVYTYTDQLEIVSIVDLNTNLYASSFELNNKEKFVIEISFKNWLIAAGDDKNVRVKVAFGGFFYSSFPLFDGERFHIGEEETGIFYGNDDYVFKNDIKLTIKKNNDLLLFFMDEEFTHAMEFKPLKNNLIEASFDRPINMDIKIFQFE